MTKIVINECYGGFSLSREAVLLAREISGDPRWGEAMLKGEVYSTGEVCKYDHGLIHGIARHDPVLVQVVEQLGEKASSELSKLRIVEIPKGTRYRVTEYDGFESIERDFDGFWDVAE